MPDNPKPIPVEALNSSQQSALIMERCIGDQPPLDCLEALKSLSLYGGYVEVEFELWHTPEKYDSIINLATVIHDTSLNIRGIRYVMPIETRS